MKKNLVVLLLLQLIASLLTGCSQPDKAAWSNDYSTGLIMTREDKETSEILLLDADGNVEASRNYPYGTMGHFGYQQQVIRDGVLYEAPLGIASDKDFGKIIGIDLQTGESSEYDLKRDNITAIDADDTYIYALSNLNGVTWFDRVDPKSGEISSVSAEDIMTLHICAHEGRLYGFCERLDRGGFELYCLDFEQTAPARVLDLTNYVNEDPVLLKADRNQLFFVSDADLYVYDLTSGKLTGQKLEEGGAYAAFPNNDTIYIVRMNSDYTSTEIELYDRNTLERISSITIPGPYYQLEFDGETLVFSSSSGLYYYDISDRSEPQLIKNSSFEANIKDKFVYGGFFLQ